MRQSDTYIVLFDGVCNFCNAAVQFIIRRDPGGLFRFASLQSRTGQELLGRYPELRGVDSVILLENGVPYIESSAALRIASRLRWPWKLAGALRLVPRSLRDVCYRMFAKRRYRWFGRQDACMVPTKDIRDQFLPD
jgi:predicted DCC family thiol-disulfide oxidoreductase YuxK